MNETPGCLFPSSSNGWPCQNEDDARCCREVVGLLSIMETLMAGWQRLVFPCKNHVGLCTT